ncbi:nuclear transport factor 2 family protein [Plantactinospora sonchi]|uniref:Nuclear transport factor 2 family protein n=1 Tax=Plantactinospora sonchi TaxID=1544735 RepID=A0ABU7RPN2_9ACTN
MNDRVRRHTELFNASFRSGDWSPFLATFTEDAVMSFGGVPVGPFHGRAAIAEAYARQPPTDTMRVDSVRSEGDTDLVRFAWSAGGTGTMRVCWRDDQVVGLTITFDS